MLAVLPNSSSTIVLHLKGSGMVQLLEVSVGIVRINDSHDIVPEELTSRVDRFDRPLPHILMHYRQQVPDVGNHLQAKADAGVGTIAP